MARGKSISINVGGNFNDFKDELNDAQKAYKKTLNSMSKKTTDSARKTKQAWRDLGVTSIADTEQRIKRLKQAFEVVKRSGTASSKDIANAQRALKQRIKEVRGEVHKTKTAFSGFSLFGAAATTVGIGYFIKRQLEAIDKTAKFATRLGMSTEALSEFSHVAKLSGIPVNAFNVGLQRMVRRIAEVATTGKGVAKDTLDQLGLSAQRLAEMEPDKQFEELAEALSQVDDEGKKVLLAFKLFDTEGVGMLQAMKNGAAGVREMRQEARSLGLTISDELKEDVENANDAITRFGGVFQGLTNSILPFFTSAIEKANKMLSSFVRSIDDAAGSGGYMQRVFEYWLGATEPLQKAHEELRDLLDEQARIETRAQSDKSPRLKIELRDLEEQIARKKAEIAQIEKDYPVMESSKKSSGAVTTQPPQATEPKTTTTATVPTNTRATTAAPTSAGAIEAMKPFKGNINFDPYAWRPDLIAQRPDQGDNVYITIPGYDQIGPMKADGKVVGDLKKSVAREALKTGRRACSR